MNDNHSLSHSKWNCKYHIVFAPKYLRRVNSQSKFHSGIYYKFLACFVTPYLKKNIFYGKITSGYEKCSLI